MNIQQLAKIMGVSESDVKCMAQSVVNDLVKDEAADAFIAADASIQTDLAVAYAQHSVKKFEQFHTTYMTNPAARNQFQQSVLSAN